MNKGKKYDLHETDTVTGKEIRIEVKSTFFKYVLNTWTATFQNIQFEKHDDLCLVLVTNDAAIVWRVHDPRNNLTREWNGTEVRFSYGIEGTKNDKSPISALEKLFQEPTYVNKTPDSNFNSGGLGQPIAILPIGESAAYRE